MKDVLFVQGGGEGAHDEWDSELVASLREQLGPQYAIRFPRMPNEGDPNYAAWKAALEAEFATLADRPVLVGHSIGGTILINALAERTAGVQPNAIVLIAAPFIGEGGWESDDIAPRDLAASLPRDVPVLLYHGTDDPFIPREHAPLYAKAIPGSHLRMLEGRDHQLNNDLSTVAADIRALRVG